MGLQLCEDIKKPLYFTLQINELYVIKTVYQ